MTTPDLYLKYPNCLDTLTKEGITRDLTGIAVQIRPLRVVRGAMITGVILSIGPHGAGEKFIQVKFYDKETIANLPGYRRNFELMYIKNAVLQRESGINLRNWRSAGFIDPDRSDIIWHVFGSDQVEYFGDIENQAVEIESEKDQ